MKKVLGYLFYLLAALFCLSLISKVYYTIIYFDIPGFSNLRLSIVTIVFFIIIIWLFFYYGRKWTTNKQMLATDSKGKRKLKKVLGYFLYPLGLVFSLSFIGNIMSLIYFNLPDSFGRRAENIGSIILALIFAILCFKYARKWTKKKPQAIEIDEIGKE